MLAWNDKSSYLLKVAAFRSTAVQGRLWTTFFLTGLNITRWRSYGDQHVDELSWFP